MLKASWSDACESLKDAFLQPTESSYWGWTEQNTNQREGLHSPRNKSKVFCVPERRINTATVYLHRCPNTIPGAKWGAFSSSKSSLWTLVSAVQREYWYKVPHQSNKKLTILFKDIEMVSHLQKEETSTPTPSAHSCTTLKIMNITWKRGKEGEVATFVITSQI